MKYGLLGGKLAHSLSPAIHKLFFAYTGIKGDYQLLETPAEALPAMLSRMQGAYQGCNVTIPHKVAVMPLLDKISAEAEAIGAVNTIYFHQGRLEGHNTDYFGFAKMLDFNNIAAVGKTAAVLGSGGAARAVVKYFTDIKVGRLYLVTRNPQQVDEHFYKIAPDLQVIDYQQLEAVRGEVLVNCTPVGMYPHTDSCPVKTEVIAGFNSAVDLIYNPSQTLFLQEAARQGKKAVNGLFMLVAQAVAAQEIWQQQEYESQLIKRIMTELEQSL